MAKPRAGQVPSRTVAYVASRLVRDYDWVAGFGPDVAAAAQDMAEELWWRSGGPKNPVNPGEQYPG